MHHCNRHVTVMTNSHIWSYRLKRWEEKWTIIYLCKSSGVQEFYEQESDISEHPSIDQRFLSGSEVLLEKQLMCFYQRICGWMLESVPVLSLIQAPTSVNKEEKLFSFSVLLLAFTLEHTQPHDTKVPDHLSSQWQFHTCGRCAERRPADIFSNWKHFLQPNVSDSFFLLYFLFFNLHSGCTVLSSAHLCTAQSWQLLCICSIRASVPFYQHFSAQSGVGILFILAYFSLLLFIFLSYLTCFARHASLFNFYILSKCISYR